LLERSLLALLGEHRAHGGHHLLMGFGHGLEQVPRKVHAAALPVAALQHPAHCVGQAPVGVADHELAPLKAALFQ